MCPPNSLSLWFCKTPYAAYLERDDFSRRLYVAVEALGETQVNRVLKHVPGVTSVENYISENGFEGIDDWKDNEVRKFMLEDEIRRKKANVGEMQSELDSMFSDYRTSSSENNPDYANGGANKW